MVKVQIMDKKYDFSLCRGNYILFLIKKKPGIRFCNHYINLGRYKWLFFSFTDLLLQKYMNACLGFLGFWGKGN